MAGKGGAPRAPSFRDMNLDFWLKGGGEGGVEKIITPSYLNL